MIGQCAICLLLEPSEGHTANAVTIVNGHATCYRHLRYAAAQRDIDEALRRAVADQVHAES